MSATPLDPPADGTQVVLLSRASLIVRQPDGRTRTIVLTREPLTIGRHPTNDVVVDLSTASAEHAVIEHIDGQYRLTDRGSRNGTFVNGQRITIAMLADGDIIRIGDARGNSVSLTFNAGHAPQTTAVETFDLAAHDTLTVGRDPACDLTLDSPLVSRRHARLERAGPSHILIDLGSTNGTFVNSERIDRRVLSAGDIVQIGPYRLTYQPAAISQVMPRQQRGRLDALHLTRRIDGGRRGHDGRLILNDVSLSIAPREFVAIVGGSGTGKTTLLNALCGFEPAEGRVLLSGDDFYEHFDLYRSLIGYVPQDDIIHRELPVGQALRYAAQLRLPADTTEGEIEARIERVLAEVDMSGQAGHIIGQLSGGQRKRVSIGVELLAEPGVFFLDEATSGLDPGLEKKLMYTLRRLADGGRTVILVTHATANIRQCDHVAFMGAGGRLVFFGPPTTALEFFNVREFADIYGEIDADPALWEKRFRESTYYERYVLQRLPNLDRWSRADGRAPASAAMTGAPARLAPRARPLRQFSILTQRYFELVVRDKMLLTILLAVMPAIGLLLGLIAQPSALVGDSTARIAQITAESGVYAIAGQAQVILLMMALASILVGVFAGSFELVRERPIFRRERMVNLRLSAYLTSKFVVLAGFAALQVMALIVVVALRVQFPFNGALLPGPLEIYLTLLLASIAGITLGLLISALAASQNSVIYVVLLVIFAQIMFGGILFNVPRSLSALTLTRWTVEALGGTIDLPALNQLGQIEVRRIVDTVDPTTGQKVQREVIYRDKLTSEFNVDYAHSPGHVASRWAILIGLAAIFAAGTAWAQARWAGAAAARRR